MKTKQYLHVGVEKSDGTIFYNHLKLSEVYLINKMVKDGYIIHVQLDECTPEQYKYIFG
jgi:hypothetical protein